ncbi:hypothetical protein MNBD_DELTA03-187, partial [hydrothermal vent metagenome]
MQSAFTEDITKKSLPRLALFFLLLGGFFGLCTLYPLIFGGNAIFYALLTAHLATLLHLWLPCAEAAIFIIIASEQFGYENLRLEKIVRLLIFVGALFLIAGALKGETRPAPIDYAPLFPSPIFLAGMGLIYTGWATSATILLRAFLSNRREIGPNALMICVCITGVIATLVSVFAAFVTMPESAGARYPYISLFYGAGHIIQFVRIPLMVLLFSLMLGSCFGKTGRRLISLCMATALLLSLLAPVQYFLLDPVTQTTKPYWTLLLGGGLGSLTTISIVTILFSRRTCNTPFPLVIIASLSFLVSGILPGMADRIELTLTAHYHGLLGALSATYCAFLFENYKKSVNGAIAFATGTFIISITFGLMAG